MEEKTKRARYKQGQNKNVSTDAGLKNTIAGEKEFFWTGFYMAFLF